MPLSTHFSEKEIKRILISTRRLRILVANNVKRCSQISNELKNLMDDHKHLISSFAVVSLKYATHRRSAPSSIYHRRRTKRQEILEDCVTEYVNINDKLLEIYNNLKEIKCSVEGIAKNQSVIFKLQNYLRKLLVSRLGKHFNPVNCVLNADEQ